MQYAKSRFGIAQDFYFIVFHVESLVKINQKYAEFHDTVLTV